MLALASSEEQSSTNNGTLIFILAPNGILSPISIFLSMAALDKALHSLVAQTMITDLYGQAGNGIRTECGFLHPAIQWIGEALDERKSDNAAGGEILRKFS